MSSHNNSVVVNNIHDELEKHIRI